MSNIAAFLHIIAAIVHLQGWAALMVLCGTLGTSFNVDKHVSESKTSPHTVTLEQRQYLTL